MTTEPAFSYQHLNRAAADFKNGDRLLGFENFKYASDPYKHKVYEQIWIDRGRPRGNAEYGRQTFHDIDGLSSTTQEKAAAIDSFLSCNPLPKATSRVSEGTNPRARALVGGCDDWGHQNYVRNPQKYTPSGNVRNDYNPPIQQPGHEWRDLCPKDGDSPAVRDGKITGLGVAVGIIGTAIVIAIVCL